MESQKSHVPNHQAVSITMDSKKSGNGFTVSKTITVASCDRTHYGSFRTSPVIVVPVTCLHTEHLLRADVGRMTMDDPPAADKKYRRSIPKNKISKRRIRKTRCGMMWVPDCWANDLRNTGPGTLDALKMVGVSGTSRHSCAEKQGTGDEASNLGQLHSDKPTLNIQLMKHGHPKS
jgi:hypothetical protein